MERYEHYTDTSQFILPALDTAFIFAAFRLADHAETGMAGLAGYAPFFFVIFALLWGILSRQYANIYRPDRLITYAEKLRLLLRTFALHAGLMLLGALVLHVQMPLVYVATVYGFAMVGVVVGRFALAFGYRTYRQFVAEPPSRFVIVGTGASGQRLYHFLTSREPGGSEFDGFFVEDNEVVPDGLRSLVRGTVAELKAYCRSTQIDELYFALPFDRHALIEDLSSFATENFLSFRIVPDYSGTVGRDVSVYFFDRQPILTVRNEPLGIHTNQVLKRMFDISFSTLVVGGVFPIVMPLLALLIKLDSPGPVFFKQMRPGRRNQLFPCYKLRTMRNDHNQTELQATKSDPRVTRVGKYLRKYNLDELPQFFNVLLGHMSVVGPRPNMVSQLEEYSKHIRSYSMRHAVVPGITGYAQVNGCRGETRAPQAMEKRVEYDLKYLESWSFSLDLQIIGQTVRNMVRGEKNAY
ncbi:exopolysaccharide biosynthesis polyprenyl glycosylphosphotransferase [Hymenobacter terricola]|uniref:exopolysaccharide biosynthesis polyprenyl glycosylphosphotransferase n=1 Tax=Hymenobacter terricola TaxID=2819236 RepID=UPI001B30116A|nr:exopolysaccharide biosynthesis polyprenyl glycosylphosphotransferase [Hymenobacter terricola]